MSLESERIRELENQVDTLREDVTIARAQQRKSLKQANELTMQLDTYFALYVRKSADHYALSEELHEAREELTAEREQAEEALEAQRVKADMRQAAMRAETKIVLAANDDLRRRLREATAQERDTTDHAPQPTN